MYIVLSDDGPQFRAAHRLLTRTLIGEIHMHTSARLFALALSALVLPSALASPRTDSRIGDASPHAHTPGRLPDSPSNRIDLTAAWGNLSRGSAGADAPLYATYDNNFESLALEPTPLLGQPAGGVWGAGAAGSADHSIISAASAGGSGFAVLDPLSGNNSVKLRMRVTAQQPPDGFFTMLRYNFSAGAPGSPQPPNPPRTLLIPTTANPTLLSTDVYLDTLDTLWTHEAINVTAGFIVDRLLWGGTNSTPDIGLPVGPIPYFHNLRIDPHSFVVGGFRPLTFPQAYSGPQTPGPNNEMSVPSNTWFRVTHEGRIDGTVTILIDYNDGQGPIPGFQDLAITAPRIDRLAINASFESLGAMYIDNLHLAGAVMVLPMPPPLECANGQYLDDLEWLNEGPLFGQSTRWTDRLSAKAFVTPDGAQGQVLRQVNVFPDDEYRQENRTSLPLTFATPGNPFSVCTMIKLQPNNATVRGIAPVSNAKQAVLSRIFIGREAPPTPYSNAVYVQIDETYDPIDEPGVQDPFANNPVIGVDVHATGFNWPLDDIYRNTCFTVTDSRAMTISVSGITIHTGVAFVSYVDALWFESENNAAGAGNAMSWDTVDLDCFQLPILTLPFALVYTDDLEWGIPGLTIGLHDDDGNSATPFRWASAPNMPIQQTGGSNTTKVLRMENLFRDTDPLPPNDPDFLSFTQASTRLPNVVASSSRGWATSGQYMLTNGATTRVWSPGQQSSQPNVFSLSTRIAFSSVTQTFWYTAPNPAFVCPPTAGVPAALWTDSGTSLSSLAVNFGSFFQLSIHKHLGGNHTFRINGRVLRDGSGAPIKPMSLSTCNDATLLTSKNLDILFFSSADDNTASPGSILYADNIRAWALPCLGDTNDDGVVNFTDLNNALSFYGQSGPNIGGNVAPDADHDGIPDDNLTNFVDLNAVLSGFGVPCT